MFQKMTEKINNEIRTMAAMTEVGGPEVVCLTVFLFLPTKSNRATVSSEITELTILIWLLF